MESDDFTRHYIIRYLSARELVYPPPGARMYVKAGLWTLDWTHGLDYGLDYGPSFGLSRLMLPDVTVCKWLKLLFKVPWALAKAF